MLLSSLICVLFPKIYSALTGLDATEFDELIHDILPRWEHAERRWLSRQNHQRDIGGGPHFDLGAIDQLLLTVILLRRNLTREVLGFLFGVSDTTAERYIQWMLPLLEKSGRDTMRRLDPGRRHRQGSDNLLNGMPKLNAVVIDPFDQYMYRYQERWVADAFYSRK